MFRISPRKAFTGLHARNFAYRKFMPRDFVKQQAKALESNNNAINKDTHTITKSENISSLNRSLNQEKVTNEINTVLENLSPKTADLISKSRRGFDRNKQFELTKKRLEFSKIKDYRSPTTKANEKLAEKIYRRIANKHYAKENLTEDQKYQKFCKELDEHAQKLFDPEKTDVWTRVQPDTLVKILETGEFKSLVELGEGSTGNKQECTMLSPETRIHMEEQIFGYRKDLPAESRPYYGHPSDSPSGNIGKDFVSSFGSIGIRYKKALVKDAVSFTGDDSAKHANGSIRPALWGYLHRGIFPLKRVKEGKLVNNYKNPLQIKSMHDIHPYPELQIHPAWIKGGRLTLEHIDAVVIREPLYDPQLKDNTGSTKTKLLNLIEALEKHGIKYPGKNADKQRNLLQNVSWLKDKAGSLKFLDHSYQD